MKNKLDPYKIYFLIGFNFFFQYNKIKSYCRILMHLILKISIVDKCLRMVNLFYTRSFFQRDRKLKPINVDYLVKFF